MSQSPMIPEVVAEFKADLVDAYTFNALAAFVTYEYIITFGQEVTMVWRRRWSLVTWMFVANRYLMIGLMIYTISPFTAKVRPTIFVYKSIAYLALRGTPINQIMGMAQFSVFAAFSALRAFAIWDRNVYIAALVLLLNLVPVGTGIYTTARGTAAFIVDPILGTFCMGYPDISASLNFALALGARLAVIIADIVVLALTWRKTFRNRIDGIRNGVSTPLTNLLLRDGTVYFGSLLAMNITLMLVVILPSLQNIAAIATYAQYIPPIIISRFLFNLRQVGESEDSNTQHTSRFSGVGFRVPTMASIVGNIGEELDYRSTEDSEENTSFEDGDLDPQVKGAQMTVSEASELP